MHLPLPRQFADGSAPIPESSAGLTLFFPAYNDAGTISSLVVRAVQVASSLTPDFEILVINDGSEDATGAIAEELARTYPQVKVIHHLRNRGYGGALRTGFAAARKSLIAYTDGDGQYDAAELEALWVRLTPEVDIVTGYKISRSDPLHRIVIGRIYHHIVKLMFGLRVRDVDSRREKSETREAAGLAFGAGFFADFLLKESHILDEFLFTKERDYPDG
jgi:glycosyltransferase involved in cell wall biosynthesis